LSRGVGPGDCLSDSFSTTGCQDGTTHYHSRTGNELPAGYTAFAVTPGGYRLFLFTFCHVFLLSIFLDLIFELIFEYFSSPPWTRMALFPVVHHLLDKTVVTLARCPAPVYLLLG
jgi:hypothetical protein